MRNGLKDFMRKMKGFYWASIMGVYAFTLSFIGIVIAGPIASDLGSLFQWFAIYEISVTGGFFGFNGVEHLTKAWGQKKNES